MGSWMVSRAGLDALEKRKFSYPCRESNPGSPAHRWVLRISRRDHKREVKYLVCIKNDVIAEVDALFHLQIALVGIKPQSSSP
jgi:hypothetical protein